MLAKGPPKKNEPTSKKLSVAESIASRRLSRDIIDEGILNTMSKPKARRRKRNTNSNNMQL